jgi:hypothetical protein
VLTRDPLALILSVMPQRKEADTINAIIFYIFIPNSVNFSIIHLFLKQNVAKKILSSSNFRSQKISTFFFSFCFFFLVCFLSAFRRDGEEKKKDHTVAAYTGNDNKATSEMVFMKVRKVNCMKI